MNEGKFIAIDVTDEIIIGGYGNLEGNLGLTKYNGEKIKQMIIENNNEDDNIRLVNSLLKSIKELEQELQKYKSLYENEKEHTDTLKRIIKEVKEYLEKHLNAKSYGNHKYELFDRKYLEDLLDLLKEIK